MPACDGQFWLLIEVPPHVNRLHGHGPYSGNPLLPLEHALMLERGLDRFLKCTAFNMQSQIEAIGMLAVIQLSSMESACDDT